MDFKKIPKIENSQFYLDLAFKRARKASDALRKRKYEKKVDKAIEIELARLNAVRDILKTRFEKIIMSFPNFNKLDSFYLELSKARFDVIKVKKSLAKMNKAIQLIEKFYSDYVKKIKAVRKTEDARKLRNAFYGRVSSIVEDLDKELKVLGEAAKKMKKFPVIRDDLFTVAITGFPNVGKSTLLRKITNANPEIAPYAFTTKTLNVGYLKLGPYLIQFVDTPGTLAREKLNKIEEEAFIAMKYAADLIIYIFDLTQKEILERQYKLLEKTKEFGKPIIKYLSKTDLLNEKEVREFLTKEKDTVTKIEELKEVIRREFIKRYKESKV